MPSSSSAFGFFLAAIILECAECRTVSTPNNGRHRRNTIDRLIDIVDKFKEVRDRITDWTPHSININGVDLPTGVVNQNSQSTLIEGLDLANYPLSFLTGTNGIADPGKTKGYAGVGFGAPLLQGKATKRRGLSSLLPGGRFTNTAPGPGGPIDLRKILAADLTADEIYRIYPCFYDAKQCSGKAYDLTTESVKTLFFPQSRGVDELGPVELSKQTSGRNTIPVADPDIRHRTLISIPKTLREEEEQNIRKSSKKTGKTAGTRRAGSQGATQLDQVHVSKGTPRLSVALASARDKRQTARTGSLVTAGKELPEHVALPQSSETEEEFTTFIRPPISPLAKGEGDFFTDDPSLYEIFENRIPIRKGQKHRFEKPASARIWIPTPAQDDNPPPDLVNKDPRVNDWTLRRPHLLGEVTEANAHGIRPPQKAVRVPADKTELRGKILKPEPSNAKIISEFPELTIYKPSTTGLNRLDSSYLFKESNRKKEQNSLIIDIGDENESIEVDVDITSTSVEIDLECVDFVNVDFIGSPTNLRRRKKCRRNRKKIRNNGLGLNIGSFIPGIG